jgi:hypothetical protein
MQSQSAFEFRPALFAILVTGVATTPARAADDKQACSAAYDQTQALRQAGKLSAARQQAVACMRDTCAEFVRTDCTRWLGEIDTSVPTVVFEITDVHGKDTAAVRVWLDGKPWLDKLDVKAVPMDPGDHTLRYEIDGASPHEESVRIREGEKNRKLVFSFQQLPSTAPLQAPPTSSGAGVTPKPSAAPWVVGGLGVAGLIVGGIFGGLTLAAQSAVRTGCNDTTHTCTPAGHSAAENGKTFGPVSTVGLAVGGVGVVTSIVLFATRKPSSGARVGMGPLMTPRGAEWRTEVSF